MQKSGIVIEKDNYKELYDREKLILREQFGLSSIKKAVSGAADALNPATIIKKIQAMLKNVSIFKTIPKITKSLMQKIGKLLSSIKKGISSGFKGPSKAFSGIFKKLGLIGKGLKDIFAGLLVEEPQGIGKGMRVGLEGISSLMFWSGEYFFSHIYCWIVLMKNLHRCIMYYVIDSFSSLMYKFFSMFFNPDSIISKARDLDVYFHSMSGFYLTRYPKDVHKTCYSCKRLKVLALKQKSEQINYDFTKRLPALLNIGVKRMKKGAGEMKQGFR
jgi:hypothetical protein